MPTGKALADKFSAADQVRSAYLTDSEVNLMSRPALLVLMPRVVFVLLWVSLAWALQNARNSDPAGKANALQLVQVEEVDLAVSTLEREFREAQQNVFEHLATITDKVEYDRYLKEHTPDPTSFAQRFFNLATSSPGSKAAAKCHGWILVYAPDSILASSAMMKLASEDYDEDVAASISGLLSYQYRQHVTEGLEKLAGRARTVEARLWFRYHFATHLLRLVAAKEATKRERSHPEDAEEGLDAASIDWIGRTNPEMAMASARRCLEAVARQGKGVNFQGRNLGALAEAALFECRHLAIGEVAPDIQGEDIEGRPLRLSEFRGKVVVVSFWGHW